MEKNLNLDKQLSDKLRIRNRGYEKKGYLKTTC